MVSLSNADIAVIAGFFLLILAVGFLAGRKSDNTQEGFLLSGRKIGLTIFILTNVSTWYGGILGVGEFTYNYGIMSWISQGLPFYIFAIIFALFFAEKIRNASLFTIPEKLTLNYGKKAGLFAAVLIFILVSPAPYLLMIGSLLSLIFDIPLIYTLLAGLLVSGIYLYKGGYTADLITDAFEFFVMFAGFIVIVLTAYNVYGGADYLLNNLPSTHFHVTGGASPFFLIVWFLIALWTFADPGFHQRCYAAKTGKIAKKGLIISVGLWAFFDFLTTTTGLYARAANPGMENPMLSFPVLAESILGPGMKGLFYAALFATIMSTLNSFLFLSGITFGKDILSTIKNVKQDADINKYTRIGIFTAAVISLLMSLYFKSAIEIWYVLGSICIPGLIFPIFGAYYERFSVGKKFIFTQMVSSVSAGLLWYIIREVFFTNSWAYDIEPMLAGLATGGVFYLVRKNPTPGNQG